jgi:hypothetical protein
MHLSIRTLGAAIAATVAFGVAPPTAVAAPPSNPGTGGGNAGQAPKADGPAAQKPGAEQKPDAGQGAGQKPGKDAESNLRPKPAKVADRISNRLARTIAKRDARLDKVVENRLANLDDVDVAAVMVENLAADQATLAELRDAALAAADGAKNLREVRGNVREVRSELRQLRLVNYIVASNLLIQAERVQGVVEANAATFEGVSGLDLSVAVAANEEAAAAIASAVEKALEITALTPRSALHEVRVDLRTARQALAVVAAALEGVEEPAEEELTEEEPVEEPVAEEPAV